MRRRLLILAATIALAGCSKPAELAITDGWVRLAAVPDRPAAGYFVLRGGAADTTLISVTSPLALRSELHASMTGDHGAMTMAPLARVALPAGGEVRFAPAGKHVMLFGLNRAVKPGGTVPLALTFADGRKLEYRAQAIAAGAPAPQF